MKVKIILISKELVSVPKYHSNQLAEHWVSIPKVIGSIPTVVRHIFSFPGVIKTQSDTKLKVNFCR